MKLYATVTSERASKGQGGNKQLDIDILIFDRQNPLYHITITDEKLIFTERGYGQPLLERNHKDIKEMYQPKSQTAKNGEHRKMCGKCATNPKWDMYDTCEHYKGD